MVQLVSLVQASAHLRIDNTDDDNDLTLKISAASNAVINYLGAEKSAEIISFDSAGEVVFDSNDEPVGVPEEIQACVLIILGMLYNDRDGEDFNKTISERTGNIIMPRIVHLLLDPYKLPIIA